MMRRKPVLLFAVLLSAGSVGAQGQPPPTVIPPPGQQQPPPMRTVRDSTGRDSTKVKAPLVHWPAKDSILTGFEARPGRSITRFFGDSFFVDRSTNTLRLFGKPAAISRDSAVIVGDTIVYSDSLQILIVRGPRIVLRDPARNASDVEARGVMSYDMLSGRATLADVCTDTQEAGSQYFLCAGAAAFVRDSVSNRSGMYGHYGSLTTCDDPNPHFHIKASTFKMIFGRFLVARPAIFYIADVPVMILPFIINDLRSGRRSGLLRPRFGFSDVIRNSSSYRRQIEDVGVYLALNDYMDSRVWLDWRSGSNPRDGDPGMIRYTADLNYKWLDRFLSGRVGLSHTRHGSGQTNTQINITHQQQFSLRRSLNVDLNYVTSTSLQQREEVLYTRELQTIRSRANYSHTVGPFQISAGGARTQYPGQEQEDQTFPSLSISSKPIALTSFATFTPNFSGSNSQRFNVEKTGPLSYRYFTLPDGTVDSLRVSGDSRNTNASLDLPLAVGGRAFTVRFNNSFSMNDVEDDFPQIFVVRDVRDTSISETRTYSRTYRTDLDWRTSVSIPATFFSGTLNLTPSFGIANVHPGPFWVRSERSGGEFVSQSKRPQFGVSVSPTIYGLFGGFGPYSRIRHSIAFSLGYSYSPAASVSDEYLEAIGSTLQGYLGALPQSQLSFGMNHVFEAKIGGDSVPGSGRKVRLLSLNMTALTWDFERAKATGGTGLSTDRFGVTARSDLLPGLDFSADWSLFQGSLLSDSARFKPFLTGIRTSFSISPGSNPIASFISLFTGKKVSDSIPEAQPGADTKTPAAMEAALQGLANSPVSQGLSARNAAYSVGNPTALSLRMEYSLTRQRPPVGDVILAETNIAAKCQIYLNSPLAYESCLQEFEAIALADQNSGLRPPGGVFFPQATRSSLSSSLSTPLTKKWAASWTTSYDFALKQFASHIFNLKRDMHDAEATFSFTQSPRGNFMFSFVISLKAQPEIKIDYQDASYGRPGG